MTPSLFIPTCFQAATVSVYLEDILTLITEAHKQLSVWDQKTPSAIDPREVRTLSSLFHVPECRKIRYTDTSNQVRSRSSLVNVKVCTKAPWPWIEDFRAPLANWTLSRVIKRIYTMYAAQLNRDTLDAASINWEQVRAVSVLRYLSRGGPKVVHLPWSDYPTRWRHEPRHESRANPEST